MDRGLVLTSEDVNEEEDFYDIVEDSKPSPVWVAKSNAKGG